MAVSLFFCSISLDLNLHGETGKQDVGVGSTLAKPFQKSIQKCHFRGLKYSEVRNHHQHKIHPSQLKKQSKIKKAEGKLSAPANFCCSLMWIID